MSKARSAPPLHCGWLPVLQKQSPPLFWPPSVIYWRGRILFTKTLLLPNPFTGPGCYDENERGACPV
ncbi:MAG TPA: hypothetical protein VIL78_08155 [Hanamia sp.]